MKPDTSDIQLLIELYVDGELDAADRERAESVLESDASAREYLLALREMRELVAAPIGDVVEAADFTGLFERIAGELHLDEGAARTAEMDALVVAWADGQLADSGEARRVEAYVAVHPEAAAGADAVRELGDLVRAPIENAAEQVDFDALARRIDHAVAAEQMRSDASAPPAETKAGGSWLSRVIDAMGGRAVLASAATAAAVVVIMLPFTSNRSGGEGVEIHNHYYETGPAETVGYQWESIDKGYEGTFSPGDKVQDMAPVIWIAPEGSSDWEKDPGTDPDAGHDLDTSL